MEALVVCFKRMKERKMATDESHNCFNTYSDEGEEVEEVEEMEEEKEIGEEVVMAGGIHQMGKRGRVREKKRAQRCIRISRRIR